MLPPLKPEIFELSMEQQFNLRVLSKEASEATPEQLQEMLLSVISQAMVKDNIIAYLTKSR